MPKYTVAVALYKQSHDLKAQLIGTNRKYSLDEMEKADELYYRFENKLSSQLQKIESTTLPVGSVFNWITLETDGTIIREAIYADANKS